MTHILENHHLRVFIDDHGAQLLSIVENTSLMGIPYPPALKNAIEVLQKQTGRKDDNDD